MREVLLAFIVLITISSVYSQEWQEVPTPGGGKIFQLAIDQSNSSKMYAVTMRGIYKSEDSAKTWNIIPDTPNFRKIALADGLYACGPDGIFRIRDNNKTTLSDKFKGCSALLYTKGKLYISLDSRYPETPTVIIYDTDKKTWRYISPKDDLFNFSVQENFLFQTYYRIRNIAVNGKNILASVYFDAGGESETFFDSTQADAGGNGDYSKSMLIGSNDNGVSWKRISLPVLEDLIVKKIVNDNETHLLVSLRHKNHLEPMLNISELVLESYDFGGNWEKINASFMTNGVNDIDKINETYYFSLIDQGIVTYSGYTKLHRIPHYQNDKTNRYRIDELIISGNDYYGVGMYNFGILKSHDLNAWEKSDIGISGLSPSIVSVNPDDPDNFVIASNVGQIPYETVDGGKTWYELPLAPDFFFTDEVKISKNNAFFINEFTQTAKIDLQTLNSQKMSPEFTSASILRISGVDTPYVSNKGICVSYKIKDWRCLDNSPDYSYAFDAQKNEIIIGNSKKSFENLSSIVIFEEGKIKKTDVQANSITSVASSPNNQYIGIAGARGDIISLQGDSWKELSPPLTFSNIHAIAADPVHDNIAYAAPWGGGLFRSTDYGNSWEKLDAPTFSAAAILIDPNITTHILIGDRLSPQIFESFDSGKTWKTAARLDSRYYRISAMHYFKDRLYFSVFNRISIFSFFGERLKGTTFYLEGDKAVKVPGITRPVISFFSSDALYAIAHIKGVYMLQENRFGEITENLPDLGFSAGMIFDGKPIVTGGCDVSEDGKRRVSDSEIINGVYLLGETWTMQKSPSSIKAIALNRGMLIAGTQGGIYISFDKGITWHENNKGLEFKPVGSISLSGNQIYAGTLGGGVYSGIIENNSIRWRESKGPYPEIYNVLVKVDQTDENIIYASSYPGGIFKSIDGGITWYEKNFGLPTFILSHPAEQGYYSLDIDTVNHNILFLGIYGKGVFKSTDGGDTWFPLYGRFGQNFNIMRKRIRQILINPQNSEDVYIAADEGIYQSLNGGETWKNIGRVLGTKKVLSIEFINKTLYAGTAGYGVYSLDRKSNKWVSEEPTYSAGFWDVWDRRRYFFSSLLFDNENPNNAYLGSFPSGFFRSTDSGNSWEDSGLGLGNDGIFSLSQDQNNPDILYGGTYNGIVKSYDRGNTWQKINEGIPSEQWPFMISIDPDNPSILYAVTKNGQSKGFCYRNGFCGMVIKSNDAGATWFSIMNGLDNRSEFYNIIVYPKNSNILFLSSNKGVYISRNAGKSWQSLNNGLPTTFNQVRYNVADVLEISPDNNYLLLGLMHHGLWKMNID